MSPLKYSRLLVPRKAKDDRVVGVLSLYEPLGLLEEGRDLVACFREADRARQASGALLSSGVRAELVTDIPEEDPFERLRAASRPFPVGRRLWIDPGDAFDSQPPSGRVALRLPASRAFGTGEHESTRLLLEALEEESLGGLVVLDVGTGSGVLALAAVALGAEAAVALDADADAVFVARENLRRHAFGRPVRLLAARVEAVRGSFDLVLANLLPEEFLPERQSVLSRVAARGRLLLSGIPQGRESGLLKRLRSKRWRLASRRAAGQWSCVCLERI
ncbi:MAG TPA: 50S ribosomal protein L11 methyltransferase [Thermoanaerobaculia bacterium]|nr:50S ribosomal protein L11 methyltransferase [Thermoanaerobaculia bacterium]